MYYSSLLNQAVFKRECLIEEAQGKLKKLRQDFEIKMIEHANPEDGSDPQADFARAEGKQRVEFKKAHAQLIEYTKDIYKEVGILIES